MTDVPDDADTGSKLDGTFKRGDAWTGNRGGRPRGARNKLGNDFVAALQRDFAEHGEIVIAKVRASRPSAYLKIVAGLVPKQVEVTERGMIEGLSEDELEAGIALLQRQIEAAGGVVHEQERPAE
jgi:hypothetical protein